MPRIDFTGLIIFSLIAPIALTACILLVDLVTVTVLVTVLMTVLMFVINIAPIFVAKPATPTAVRSRILFCFLSWNHQLRERRTDQHKSD